MSSASIKRVITWTLPTEKEKEEAVHRLFRDFDRKSLEKLAVHLYLTLLNRNTEKGEVK